ncbi:VOC family protein [Photobacterium sp. MCCC 1A19761]
MMISHIDHLVLTVADIDASVQFYQRVLLMDTVTFANGRKAMKFGNQKINLQLLGQERRNKAGVGSGDLCLISSWPIEDVVAHLSKEGIDIVEGPVTKSGAMGAIESVYFTDPDQNLIEISVYP